MILKREIKVTMQTYVDRYFIVIVIVNALCISESLPNNLQCPPQNFKLKGMMNCQPWLTCSDIQKIKIHKLLGSGAVKDVYLAFWETYAVALSKLKNTQFEDDFHHGLDMLILLNPSRYIVQLLGYCKEQHTIITEYHPNGNAVNIVHTLKNSQDDSILRRLKLCLNYAEILNYIHEGRNGTRVFCDSNDLFKLLSQLLLTEDLTLVLNDLDALPEVTGESSIMCGHRELKGSFVAPEQLWNHDVPFDENKMSGYDEKTDIWKAAAVCNHFLKGVEGNEVALYRLFDINRLCRNERPSERPTANDLVSEYTKVIQELNEHEEL